MAVRLDGDRGAGRRQRQHGQPRPQRQARRQPAHASAGADRHRRARLRPPAPAAAARRSGWSAWSMPELENPFFPRFAHLVETNLAGTATRRCCAARRSAACTRTTTSGSCWSTRVVGDHLRLRHPRHRRRPPRPLPPAGRHRPADRPGQRLMPEVPAHFISTDDAASVELGLPTSPTWATAASASRWGRPATSPSSARPRRSAPAWSRAAWCPTTWTSTTWSSARRTPSRAGVGGRAAPLRRAGSPASCAART